MSDDKLPSYAAGLDAMHIAADPEFKQQIEALPLTGAKRILDLASGDGYFARLLHAAFPDAEYVAGDSSKAYRILATQRNETAGLSGSIDVRSTDATRMDFPDGSFDAVFCGYSFQSIPQHDEVLREVRRILSPDGRLVIMETDGFHQCLLPIPTELELRVRMAEYEASCQEGREAGWAFSRRCGSVLRKNGFELSSIHTFAVDRRAPFAAATRDWLVYEFDQVMQRIRPVASEALIRETQQYFSADGDCSILNSPDSFISALHTVFVATPR